MIDFVTLLLHLVRPHDHLEAVRREEVRGNVWPEVDADAALRWIATAHRLWVRPKHLDHVARIRRLAVAIDLIQLRELDAVFREEATVHDEYLAVDDVRQGQPAEKLRE